MEGVLTLKKQKKKITSACPDGLVDVDGYCVWPEFAGGIEVIDEKIKK